MRINRHPVLGDTSQTQTITLLVDGRRVDAKEGEPVAAALWAAGIVVNRYTEKNNRPRGLFCAIGRCTDCAMVVNGVPNIRTCVTAAIDGMVVETQHGRGAQEEKP